MKRELLVIVLVVMGFVVGVAAGACSGSARQDARTGLDLADEACDVAVLLEDEATWVCLGIETLDEVARKVLRERRARPGLTGAASSFARVLRLEDAGGVRVRQMPPDVLPIMPAGPEAREGGDQ